MVESSGLLNRRSSKRATGGSNPPLSARVSSFPFTNFPLSSFMQLTRACWSGGMSGGLRKSLAVLSVILLLSAVRCVSACTATGEQIKTRTDAPRCHRYQLPAHGTERPLPCQDHPGLLAYSVHQPVAPLPLPVSVAASTYQSLATRQNAAESGGTIFAYVPPLFPPSAHSLIILRI